MGSSTSNPISVNQIVDTNLDLKCITEPTCRTLPNDIQALIDEFCNSKFDSSKIVDNCITGLPESYDINLLLNKIITKLCGINSTVIPTISDYITGVNYCDSDNWTYTSSNCIQLVDNCNVPLVNVTLLDIVKLLIKRVISLEILIKELKTSNDVQQVTINTHTSQIQNIIDNCCSISLVNSIQTISARLAAAGIP